MILLGVAAVGSLGAAAQERRRMRLLHALASIDIPSGNASDAVVRDKILAELERQAWAPPII